METYTREWLEAHGFDAIKPGIYRDMPNRVYHDIEALSWSSAKSLIYELGNGPEEYWGKFICPIEDKKSSRIMDFGTLGHAVVTGIGMDEIMVFPQEEWDFIAGPGKSPRATKCWKEAYAKAESEGLTLVSPEDMLKVARLMEILQRTKANINGDDYTMAELIGLAECEVSYFAVVDGVLCKARPDIRLGKKLLIDYKVTGTCVYPEQFNRQAYNMGYHGQQEWYKMVIAECEKTEPDSMEFMFLAQRESWPHVARLIPLDHANQEAGKEACQQAIQTFKSCSASGDWHPCFQIKEAQFPVFANYRRQDV